jgi:hypothetical protein
MNIINILVSWYFIKNANFGVVAVVSNGIQVELCRTETKEI